MSSTTLIALDARKNLPCLSLCLWLDTQVRFSLWPGCRVRSPMKSSHVSSSNGLILMLTNLRPAFKMHLLCQQGLLHHDDRYRCPQRSTCFRLPTGFVSACPRPTVSSMQWTNNNERCRLESTMCHTSGFCNSKARYCVTLGVYLGATRSCRGVLVDGAKIALKPLGLWRK